MLKIYLARHGQDEDNVKSILNGQRDMPLTQKGLEQANEVANKIKSIHLKFDYVYTSPLQRTIKTAETITSINNLPLPKKLDLLIERNFGIMTGKSHDQIKELCSPNILETDTVTYFLSPEGAETFPQLIERGKKILEFIKNTHQDGNVLLVTHGDIGKMIYCVYYNLNWQDVLKMFHFGNSDLILMSPDSKPNDVHVFKIKQHNL